MKKALAAILAAAIVFSAVPVFALDTTVQAILLK